MERVPAWRSAILALMSPSETKRLRPRTYERTEPSLAQRMSVWRDA